ncbi:hypothetical protein PRK78_003120 [Emydomyces testavorans]|uniref:Uncharacterized protein n=1 Tax=Emydomyces testavorans TaxID=2070801 RepID=A0AAF0DG75_9EURO|nr:hypothetical protein PRK78_003120 [Emydomyces testavorans]
MGTRSLICVWYKGRFVIAQYTQFDGYPEGQGTTILRFLTVAGNIERLKAGIEHIKYIDDEELNEIHKKVEQDSRARHNAGDPAAFYDMMTGKNEMERSFPSLSRLAGGNILQYTAEATAEKPVLISMDLGFANDALFCEWAYCVDLDTGVFEVFGGGRSKEKSGSKRFQDVGDENAPVPTFIKSFSLDDLPKNSNEFMKSINNALKARGYNIDEEDEEEEEEEEEEEAAAEDNAQDNTGANAAGN